MNDEAEYTERQTDPQRPSVGKYVAVVLLVRLVGMVLIAFSIPLTGVLVTWVYHWNGQQGAPLIIMGVFGGVIASLVYFLISTAVHFFILNRSFRIKCLVEGVLLGMFLFLTVFGSL